MRKDGATDKMDFEYRIDNTYSHDLNANVVDGWDQAEKRVVTFSFSNAGDYRRIRLRGYTSSTDSAIFDYYDSGEVSELDNMSGTDSGDEGLWLGAQSASTDRVVDMDRDARVRRVRDECAAGEADRRGRSRPPRTRPVAAGEVGRRERSAPQAKPIAAGEAPRAESSAASTYQAPRTRSIAARRPGCSGRSCLR